jgi:hypothetical protein
MNSPRCTAAQNGCTTSEIMRLLNSINNTPIRECCDDRANRRMGICDEPCHPRRTGCSEPMTAELAADEKQVFLGASA